jgi:hypothetical protein
MWAKWTARRAPASEPIVAVDRARKARGPTLGAISIVTRNMLATALREMATTVRQDEPVLARPLRRAVRTFSGLTAVRTPQILLRYVNSLVSDRLSSAKEVIAVSLSKLDSPTKPTLPERKPLNPNPETPKPTTGKITSHEPQTFSLSLPCRGHRDVMSSRRSRRSLELYQC